MACGVLATGKSRAVALLTPTSVACADSSTAVNSSNGVLIYLLMADHRIEVVADRGLSRRVSHGEWQALADRLSSALQADQAEAGLNEAICRVGEMLRRHFPAPTDAPSNNDNDNELPDAVLLI